MSGLAPVASFRDHVPDVVALSADPEVIWIDATPNVTGVAYEESFRDGSVGNFVCKSVSEDVLSFHSDDSVPSITYASVPDPTAVNNGVVGKETIGARPAGQGASMKSPPVVHLAHVSSHLPGSSAVLNCANYLSHDREATIS